MITASGDCSIYLLCNIWPKDNFNAVDTSAHNAKNALQVSKLFGINTGGVSNGETQSRHTDFVTYKVIRTSDCQKNILCRLLRIHHAPFVGIDAVNRFPIIH